MAAPAVNDTKALQIYFKNPIDFFHQGSIISTITRKNEWQGSGYAFHEAPRELTAGASQRRIGVKLTREFRK